MIGQVVSCVLVMDRPLIWLVEFIKINLPQITWKFHRIVFYPIPSWLSVKKQLDYSGV
jgi:hypothetical protein